MELYELPDLTLSRIFEYLSADPHFCKIFCALNLVSKNVSIRLLRNERDWNILFKQLPDNKKWKTLEHSTLDEKIANVLVYLQFETILGRFVQANISKRITQTAYSQYYNKLHGPYFCQLFKRVDDSHLCDIVQRVLCNNLGYYNGELVRDIPRDYPQSTEALKLLIRMTTLFDSATFLLLCVQLSDELSPKFKRSVITISTDENKLKLFAAAFCKNHEKFSDPSQNAFEEIFQVPPTSELIAPSKCTVM